MCFFFYFFVLVEKNISGLGEGSNIFQVDAVKILALDYAVVIAHKYVSL